MRVVYLHGFASGPTSAKARYFHQKLTDRGVQVEIPRLDGGDFERLTITGQLEVVRKTVGEGPVVLFGSSLGGYLAALFAARHPERVQKLVLLAPGFEFPSRWPKRYSAEDLNRWKLEGSAPVFHYGEGREMRLGYGLMEDSLLYEDVPDVRQPTLIFHGTKDDVVPAEVSVEFTKNHPHAQLHLMTSGHELTDVLEPMWRETEKFLGL
jgi:pimeloyl-ACP methyl ester carboxylesterase